MTESAQERWLTYVELGQLFGCTPSAAGMLAKRRGWARRTPNAYGERARVLVPDDAALPPRAASNGERTGYVQDPEQPSPNGHDQANVRALEQAVAALSDALAAERARAERAELVIEHLRDRIDALLALWMNRRPWWRRRFR